MKIKWLGHSAFLITANDGTRFITDPFGKYDGLSYDPIDETANIVLISHHHGDHVGGKILGNPQTIEKTGTTEAGAIRFQGIATYHDTSGGSQRGTNIIFCFTVDGIRICHLGDLGHLLLPQHIAEIGEVDILLIPVGGFFTIDAREATEVCSQIKPKVIIPMHVRNDKCAFPIARVDDFLHGKSNVKMLDTSETEFNKETLPVSTHIVVLNHAL